MGYALCQLCMKNSILVDVGPFCQECLKREDPKVVGVQGAIVQVYQLAANLEVFDGSDAEICEVLRPFLPKPCPKEPDAD